MLAGPCLARYAALVVLTTGISPPAAAADDPLEKVQRKIAEYRGMEEAEIVERLPALAELVREYLRAYRSHLGPGGSFDIGLGGPEQREAAFRRNFAEHMRAWHPVVGLLFLEAVVSAGPAGAYARMLDLDGADAQAAIRKRVAGLALRIQEGRTTTADPLALADSLVAREIDLLWELLSAVAEDHAVRILRDILSSEPRTTRFDGIRRVGELLAAIVRQDDCRGLREWIRKPAEGAALAAALHGAATRVLSHPQVRGPEKRVDLERLLGMLVLLQMRPAADHLILLFDGFDDYADFPGVREQGIEEVLVNSVVDFVGGSVAEDPDKVLALELIDHLTRLILTRLELRFPDLLPARVIEALDLVRRTHPAINVDYIRRFHSDFHALSPAGYEAVIFQLTDILVEYAENGLFLRSPSVPGPAPVAEGQGLHQKVMDVLLWYNLALGEVPTLPDIDVFFMDREQQAVLGRIYGYFELKSGTIWELRRDDPKLIETMLMLLTRIAHAARPEDLLAHVLLPLARVEFVDQRLRSEPYLTSAMHEAVRFLWTLVGEDERQKVWRQLLMQDQRSAL